MKTCQSIDEKLGTFSTKMNFKFNYNNYNQIHHIQYGCTQNDNDER